MTFNCTIFLRNR